MTGTIITKKGMALIAKLLATGQELIFTRAAVGTGSIPKGYDPAGMIDLSQFEMNGEISGYSAENEEATVIFQISSQNVETGFMITEAGLFAEDADEGEILYAYLDLSDDPQYVYSNDSTIQKFAEIEFKTIVGAVENVTVITSPGALVTKDVFETEMEKLQTPEFDDYSGEDVEIPDARTAIAGVTSKKNIFSIFSNIKAALMGLVTLGEMRGLLVNNGLCNEPGKFFLDAAYGKNLQDQLTKLNSDFGKIEIKNYRYELMVQSMSFVKCNGIVSICYDSDWKSIPAGDLGIIARVDPEFYPIQSVRCMAFPDTSLQLTLSPQGDLFAYNYGSAFTSIKSARFFVSYVAAN